MDSGACDTHTEDVQAHCSVNALLVGEVIPGELMDCCRENTHKHTHMIHTNTKNELQVREEEDNLRDSSKQTLKKKNKYSQGDKHTYIHQMDDWI